jgi:hypothetical protein
MSIPPTFVIALEAGLEKQQLLGIHEEEVNSLHSN